ncbi:MAG: putative DNA binding domain-containing protein [Elusimicrobia bacterium]|nr:putative DNA binding domain-containing protein [Elusimicrobiota bacterium]
MIESFLARDEGKTLEFKENCRPLEHIVRTAVAFTNTVGGTLVIGVRNQTKEVVGLGDPLADEERLANAFAESIRPLLIPDIRIHAWRDRQVIVVSVPHLIGPYYVQGEGPEAGVYIRLGSTNRRAGPEIIAEIGRLVRNACFDESACLETSSEAIDFRAASEFFSAASRQFTAAKQRSLGLVTRHQGREVPTLGAVLLFGKDRRRFFPDATIRCARFAGTDMARFADQTEIDEYLPKAVESVISFIERHTRNGLRIGRVRRENRAEYPQEVVREAVVNAVVHADYAINGAGTKVGIFDDRIEITNPGFLPFGLTLEAALSGVSQLRNRVIGRVFRELELIEQWGSGMGRMIAGCAEAGLAAPWFEEIGTIGRLAEKGRVSTREAAALWGTSDRAARARLRKLVDDGVLAEAGTGPRDPRRAYLLREGR